MIESVLQKCTVQPTEALPHYLGYTNRLMPVRLRWRLKMRAAVRSVSARTAMPTPAEFIHYAAESQSDGILHSVTETRYSRPG